MASAIFSPLRPGGKGVRPAPGPTLKSGGGVSNQNDCTHKSASVFDLWSPPELRDSMSAFPEFQGVE